MIITELFLPLWSEDVSACVFAAGSADSPDADTPGAHGPGMSQEL